VRVLNRIALEQQDAPLTLADHFSLALSYGFSHAAVHSAFFFAAWLPLSLGSGTLYTAHCPRLSYFLVGALSTLGFAALLAGGMVVWFDGMERRRRGRALLVPVAHAAAALCTLGNLADGGCMVTLPLLLAGGAGVAAYAGRVWWQRATAPARLAAAGADGYGGSSSGSRGLTGGGSGSIGRGQ
jgi:hypothetical protein